MVTMDLQVHIFLISAITALIGACPDECICRDRKVLCQDQDFLESLHIVDEVLLTLNPWKCDKDIIPLRDWLKQFPLKVPSSEGILCLGPTSLSDFVIRDIPDKNLIQPTTQAPTEVDPVTPTEKRRRPHTTPSRRSTPLPTINATTKSDQGEDTSSGQGNGTSQLQGNHLIIITVVCMAIIVSTILGVACWRRYKRDSRDLHQQPKSNSVI
ncbi:hypothetical protein AALO_G00127490 [Alosa alosa]|uniref:Uncharacterized protein n=1 Tax=Alosa alosa TaxID=278164 RepID=A0AAV6GLJ6_9TELE|nr:hypothetical protein AALO_G00127490 [Alosa alosa]